MKSIIALSASILPLIAFAAADANSGAAGGTSGAAGAKPTADPKATDAKAQANAKAKADAKAEGKEKEPKQPKRGVGTVAMEAILDGASNEEALAAVRKEFPDANTTKASINWYRNKLRKDGTVSTGGAWKGKPVPNAREMAKAAKEAQEGKDAENAKAGDNKPTAGDDPMA